MESQDLARFLFELASDERLGILASIAEKPLRHSRISRHLGITDSETTRHLNRLASASLVARNSRGEFEPTNLARLLFAVFPFLRFLATNREFLMTHDVLALPPEFVERMGALSECTFETGTYKVVAYQERALKAVKRRIWVLTEQAFEQGVPILQEKASEGADVRVIRPRERFEPAPPGLQGVERNYPVRLLGETRIFLAVLDEIAGVCFPTVDGKVDMAMMLLLSDARGYRWAEDLFLHFWGEALERL